jgi:small subunit ribosomal protein S6
MRRYETIFIADPDLAEEDQAALLDRIKDTVSQNSGRMIEFDEWGQRKLAYEIKKKIRGFYVRMDYCGMGGLVSELERIMRLDDRVMKYLTVLLERDADPDTIISQKAAAKEEASSEALKANESSTVAEEEPAESDDSIDESTEDTEEDNY